MKDAGARLCLGGCAVIATIALCGCAATRPATPPPAQRVAQHNPTIVYTRVRFDPAHPLDLSSYYPLQSRSLREEGDCLVRIDVDADGRVSAAQLLHSTGHPLLDRACLRVADHARFKAATENGIPVATWDSLPINWRITGNKYPDVPQVPSHYHFDVGARHYPESARRAAQEGSCVVRALIAADGKPLNVIVRRSTGSAALDEACVRAVKAAPFIPARDLYGVAHQASTDINLIWRLPRH